MIDLLFSKNLYESVSRLWISFSRAESNFLLTFEHNRLMAKQRFRSELPGQTTLVLTNNFQEKIIKQASYFCLHFEEKELFNFCSIQKNNREKRKLVAKTKTPFTERS